MRSFEAISKHCEILTRLYRYLNFEDQLRLSRVSEQLKNVYETYIWREKYQSLTVVSHENFNFVVTNETGLNRLCLKPNEFEEFLGVFADQVLNLSLINPYLEMEIYQHVKINDHINLEQFSKLTSLHLESMIITAEFWKLLAEKCPQLQSLHLDRCVDEQVHVLKIGSNISIDALEQLKLLKRLHLEHLEFGESVSIEYQIFLETINKLKLESLNLNATLQPDQGDVVVGSSQHLKELYTKTSFDGLKWSTNYPLFMGIFATLTVLTVEILDVVSQDTLRSLAKACKSLEQFKIRKTTFANIVSFSMPSKVKEFSLHRCTGLTVDNFKQLLTELPIVKFDSRHTKYEGELDEDFRISPLLQTLTLDCVHMYSLRKAYVGDDGENVTLKNLNWYHPMSCRTTAQQPETRPRLVANPATHDPMALQSMCQLKSLNKLTIPHPMDLLKWPLITTLLQHPPLVEFRIRDGCDLLSPNVMADVPSAGFPTNIIRVTLPLDLFEMALDFWLDLFVRNDNFKTLCCSFTFFADYEDFLQMLVNHKQFPTSLKAIEVFGYTTSCNDLRTHFRTTVAKLNKDNCEDLHRIILSK